ncbi:hypothetical protein SAMN02910369_00612 [Lachnospiraceae bacterium NE2001]|nr:hypothetical protein SAMN02910369_00612 [Lachnospiraceae bacterium NE2001]
MEDASALRMLLTGVTIGFGIAVSFSLIGSLITRLDLSEVVQTVLLELPFFIGVLLAVVGGTLVLMFKEPKT